MIYETVESWHHAPRKAVALVGMSGVGKTRIASILREQDDWFHYSVDYRIGTRYLGERIDDDFKREAMKNPVLRELLRSDSLSIRSKLGFHNLAPLSQWLGKPGNAEKGGIEFDEYLKRQRLHRTAEIDAMLDSRTFMRRAAEVYDYDHFICDTSGSICEVVNPEDRYDPVLSVLSQLVQIIYIRGSEEHKEALKSRFDRAPKPMYYQEDALLSSWESYLQEHSCTPDQVDPDHFVRATFAAQIDRRAPIYQSIADNWGLTVEADEIAAVDTVEDFNDLVAKAIARR